MSYKILFLDTETTGNQPTDRITQVAYKWGHEKTCAEELFKPPVPISIESMEVTHITPKMVADKPAFEGSPMQKKLQDYFADFETIFVAHNAPFDTGMLAKDNVEVDSDHVIDTLRVARALDVDAKLPAYRLQYLRYLLDLDADIAEPIMAHDAKGDVLVLEKLFERLLDKIKKAHNLDGDDAIDKMLEISQQPVVFKRLSFGKYKGQLIADVAKSDRGYLQWLQKQKQQSDADETDWLYTLEQVLK